MNSDDEASNDVMIVDSDSGMANAEEKPIMKLFERLIGYSHKQNTVLTNAQILDILNKEFNISSNNLHELEVDIYLNIIKKFLKDWPQWDEIDTIIGKLRNSGEGATVRIQKVLEKHYDNLKSYLQNMLEATKPLAQETIKKLQNKDVEVKEKKSDDVVLEIQCTRSQLNQLIFKRPHLNLNGTIFQIIDSIPSRILVNMFTLKTILNWWWIKVNINLNNISYSRETIHNLKHRIVNKKLNEVTPKKMLSSDLEYLATVKTKPVSKDTILKILYDAFNSNLEQIVRDTYQEELELIFEVIKHDFRDAPNEMQSPSLFRQHMNTYPYTRNLSTDTGSSFSVSDAKKYDLSLEETISPMVQFSVSKLSKQDPGVVSSDCVSIACTGCSVSFQGLDSLQDLIQHFNESHEVETDWTCTNCLKSFSMLRLSENCWKHDC